MPGPVITYPGVTGVMALTGENPVGISPGQFVLECYTSSAPDLTGTLTIGDGVNASFSFPNCFRFENELEKDGGRYFRSVRLWDRRYRLLMGFAQPGHWNQIDERKKLIPRTVVSPYQLAGMLATAMGETLLPTKLEPESTLAGFDVFDIDLPGGLAQPADPARGIPAPGPRDTVIRPSGEFYRCGTNAPVTRTNPTVFWNAETNAARAMQNLCERFGRRFCPDPTTAGTSTIWPIGSGTPIPTGGVHMTEGVSVTADPLPEKIRVVCQDTVFQLRLRVEPVMPTWDGNWVVTERCPYLPTRAGQQMRVEYRVPGAGVAYDDTKTYGVTLNTVAFTSVGAGSLVATLNALAAAIPGASPLTAGLSATRVGNALRVVHATAGVEFEATTAGTTAGTSWEVICDQGPITGPRAGQPVYEITYTGAWGAGKSISVTIDGNTFTEAFAGVGDTLDAAISRLADQVNGSGLSVVSEWAPGKLLITGNAPGTAITVAAAAGGGGIAVNNVQIADTTFTPRGLERFWPAPGVGELGVTTPELNIDQVQRLIDGHYLRSFRVVGVNPDPFDQAAVNPAIPVGGYTGSPVDHRFRIILRNSRPEPVVPLPGDINVIDTRTNQPFSAEVYNGYATDRPVATYGSVHPFVIDGSGLFWRGGTYLGNTAMRQRLPFTFQIIDPQNQVIHFDQPMFRILGQGAGTAFVPAELVIEVGAHILRPTTNVPEALTVEVNTGGVAGLIVTRVLPDVERALIGRYGDYHRLTGFTELYQDCVERAGQYATDLAATFQTAAGQGVSYSGIFNVPTDGATRVTLWQIAGSRVETAVGVNCELSRALLPLAERRKAENLPFPAMLALQNLNSDFKRRGAADSAIKWYTTTTKQGGQ